MLKKILTASLLIGITGVLIWGGLNRSLAKTNEGNAAVSGSQGQIRGVANIANSVHDQNGDYESYGLLGHDRGNLDVDESPGRNNSNVQRVVTELSNSNGTQGKGFRGGGGNNGSGGQGGGFEPLDDDEIRALKLALDDENHALTVYQSVIATFGAVEPFLEIAQSEQRHIDALINQFEKHGIPVPENNWIGNVPTFDSLQAACQTGVDAEIANVDLYDQLFSMTDDRGLIQVFTNLSRASQESHLPSFQSCQ